MFFSMPELFIIWVLNYCRYEQKHEVMLISRNLGNGDRNKYHVSLLYILCENTFCSVLYVPVAMACIL